MRNVDRNAHIKPPGWIGLHIMTRKQLIRLLVATLAVAVPLLAVLAFSVSGTGLALAAPVTIIEVGDGGDTGTCAPGTWTLRCAINYANVHPGTWIRFAPGLAAVLLQSPLPAITGNGTWIDGHDIYDHCVCPRIDGLFMSSGNGLLIHASYVTISNIKVVNIPSGGADIAIDGGFYGVDSIDTVIAYDYLGILPGATQCGGLQSEVGVEVFQDNTGSVGNDHGTAYIYANNISCHEGAGIIVRDSTYVYIGTQGNGTPAGNYIGTTSDGTRAAGNGDAGVLLENSAYVQIHNNLIAYNASGGVTVDRSDLISPNGSDNVSVSYNTLSANDQGLVMRGGSTQQIVGNKIGTTPDGSLPLPNTHEGILISGGSGLFLQDNLVAYNGAAGIAVTGDSTHAAIVQNNIYRNGGLPIDLGNNGPTPNGPQSLSGPNDWLAYPVVTGFGGSGDVWGYTCAKCRVDIFKAVGNPAAPGGGGIPVAYLIPDDTGKWVVNLPNGLTRLDVTFTATDVANTSEMSPRGQLLLPLILR
jgi:Right handed beta helix region